jgi:CelD/BcsL family acetyltransferase involved in cellulose biosynthesis
MTRSPQPRRDLGRKHRRLAEKGPLDFSVITNPDDAVPAIDWMLHHKARWLERSGKEDATWIGEERFRTFLQKLMLRFGPEQRCAVLALKQGGKILAADLVSIEGSRVGWYMGTFDQEFRRHSPGHVLKEYALRWALERGLTFDMRLGDGEHKRFWATGAETTMTLRFSISAWGRIYMAAKRVQPLLRRAPRQDVLQPAA